MSLRLHWLAADPRAPFPPPEQALQMLRARVTPPTALATRARLAESG